MRLRTCLQVRVDPAGDGDPEDGREFLQRADRAADLPVQEQVNAEHTSRDASSPPVLTDDSVAAG